MKKTAESEKSGTPLYLQLARALRERIITGEYKPGEAIPTEPQLGDEFNMSRITVRQAVAILESERMVSRQQGRGTFVRDWDRESVGWNYGRVDDLPFLAKQTRLTLSSREKIKAPEDVARDLALSPGEAVYCIKGMRLIKDAIRASYCAFVIESVGKGIRIDGLKTPVLFMEAEKVAGERIQRVQQFIFATIASEALAGEMGLHAGAALLVTKRIYLTEGGRALMEAITYFPGDVYQSIAVLERG